MKYKAIIFDFDGVLFDSEKLHLQACNEVFAELGFKLSADEYDANYIGLSDKEMFPNILTNVGIKFSQEKIAELIQKKILYYKNIINGQAISGFLNVRKFLKTYADKVENFAICTGATREEIEATLKILDQGTLGEYFHSIITINDINEGKPSPEGYQLAAQRLGISPQDCLAIEDTDRGAIAAKSAGLSVIGLSPQRTTVFTNVDFIAADYVEIDNWLQTTK